LDIFELLAPNMSLTNADLRKLEQRPTGMVFLSLAPATSDSYPATQATQTAQPADAASRRSSSQSSDGKQRFLKLGPVHWGEHPDEKQEDFAVEE
jgi:hypothetical protein